MSDDYSRSRSSRSEEDGPARVANDDTRVNSFLDKGTEFDGKLAFEGAVRINGRFSGEIFSEGTLYVGENGEVNAEVQVSTAIISGVVTGDVIATAKVELQRSARLRGNIRTQVLKIEEGALFEGNCQMHFEEAAAEKPAPAAQPLPVPESTQEGLELA
ncbi:MAG: polymer-forming cytoskeletal protein [Myxococcota bacterium]